MEELQVPRVLQPSFSSMVESCPATATGQLVVAASAVVESCSQVDQAEVR